MEEGADLVASGAEVLGAALGAVDDDEDSRDLAALGLHRLDGVAEGAAGRHGVIDDHNLGAGPGQVALNETLGPVVLGL